MQTIETHMSWVFMAGDHVLKMKKPVRYPYLDFSTLAAREFCCREEVRLNSRLAPGVYEGLRALHWDGQALTLLPESALPAPGTVLDWLVRMRRLPRSRMLDALLAAHEATPAQVKALADRLLAFYKGLPAVAITGIEYVSRFEREQIVNREVLMRAEFDLHDAAAALRALDLGLRDNAVRLRERADSGHIVEGHGDLRPEHVCLLDPPVVIDALEFNAAFRQVDPLDEIAYLGMECEAAGAAWIGPQLVGCVGSALEVAQHAPLIAWYTAFRALLRARLVAAHLLEPQPRRAGHWLPLARRYVGLALRALAAS
ncbi:MAG: hypothetical protein HZC37_18250 [Burkholderiales bacterium]|nr:hypothetical protein [Burkholderiales bacterium]